MRAMAAVLVGLSLMFFAVAGHAQTYSGKRVLHIDSYHQGNTWNDRIVEAVRDTFADTGVELQVLHMDSKRNGSKDEIEAAALEAKALIESFKPDVVTTNDDNAARYLIAPYYRDEPLPFVFCGVNWDAAEYGFPYANVTGMVEVSPVLQIVELLTRYATGERIGLIAEDTLTKRKELEFHQRLFDIDYEQAYFVTTFAEWKDAFVRAQTEVDMLVILGVGALADFDDQAAAEFAQAETKIPTATDFEWLMHVSMLGVAKVPEEQGRWAAQAALKIMSGTPPNQIPLSYNKEGKLFFNPAIAARLGVTEPPPLAELVE